MEDLLNFLCQPGLVAVSLPPPASRTVLITDPVTVRVLNLPRLLVIVRLEVKKKLQVSAGQLQLLSLFLDLHLGSVNDSSGRLQ